MQQLSLKVVFSTDSVRHAHGERQSKFIRSKRRKDLQEVLQHQSPSTVYNKLFKVLSAEFYFHKPITVHLELYLFYCFIHFLLYIGQY